VLLRHREEAEDAVQQTFLSAYRSLLNGFEPRHPAAWLATIARNECWSRVERRMREPLGDAQAEPESTLPDPVAAAAAKADLSALWRAIGELPRQQRQALLLREFSGLTYGELAEALAISEPAVESLLFRARRELRLRMKPAWGSVASLAPLSAIRDALPRAIGGMPDPATPGALAKIAAAPLVAKLTAGAAAVVVAGGAVAAVENGSLAGLAPARAESVVRPTADAAVPAGGRSSIVGTAARAKRPRTGGIPAGRTPRHRPAPAPVSAAVGLQPREVGESATAPANDPAQGETPVPLPPAAPSIAPAAPTSSESPASGGGESSSTSSDSDSDEDGSEETSGSGSGDDGPGSSDDDEGSEASGSEDEAGTGSDDVDSGESGSGESGSDDSESSSDTSGSGDDGGEDDGEDDGL
jgi:RNA polymerase sigma factor (sigma-70 family)